MTHKVVSAVVGLIVMLFVGAAFAFAWALTTRAPEGTARADTVVVPHAVDATTADCADCHDQGPAAMPVTHRFYATASCAACHPRRSTGDVPHSIAMGDAKCVLCHGDTRDPVGMPEGHLKLAEGDCSFCHQPAPARADVRPGPAGDSANDRPRIPHPVKGAYKDCVYCHRADGYPSVPASHEGFAADTCRFICHVREKR